MQFHFRRPLAQSSGGYGLANAAGVGCDDDHWSHLPCPAEHDFPDQSLVDDLYAPELLDEIGDAPVEQV